MLTIAQKHPPIWIREWLGDHPWKLQEKILYSIHDNPRTAVRSCHGAGKCVAAGERIQLSNGRLCRIEDLDAQAIRLPGFLESGADVQGRVNHNGARDCYKITLRNGRELVRTSNHPLMASVIVTGRGLHPIDAGWVYAENLTADHALLAPDTLRAEGNKPKPNAEVILCAYLLADGGLTAGVTYTKPDGILKREFRSIVEKLGCGLSVRNCLTDNVTGSNGGANHILGLVREWGLFGCKSKRKRFPDWVWELPNDQLALFLNRLIASDGWVYTAKRRGRYIAQIGIALASQAMIDDISWAMLRFGIHGKIRHRRVKASKLVAQRFDAWEWRITKKSSIERFAKLIGCYGADLNPILDAASKRDQQRSIVWPKRNAPQGYHWERIKAVEYLGGRDTYNISIDHPTHAYVTQVVEHNSFVAARAALWWLYTHPQSVVMITAPTFRQVEKVVWQEIRSAFHNSKYGLFGTILNTEIKIAPKWFAFGFSTTNPDAAQGIHSDRVLVILDEASGIPESIWTAVDGCLTSANSRILSIGNPTDPTSRFAAEFKSPNVNKFKIGAYDTPNLKAGKTIYPGLITKEWVEDKKIRWGETSPMYVSRVMGEFPETSNDTLIPLSAIEAAQGADLPPDPQTKPLRVLGVDVARFGSNETVMYLRDKSKARLIFAMRGADTMQTVGRIIALSRENNADRVVVDEIGVGAGVIDRLKEQGIGVVAANAARASGDPNRFANIRAEWFWGLRERFLEGQIDIDPQDQDLASQLANLKYKIDSRGRIVIESKDEMARRGMQSPDRADALALAFGNHDKAGGFFIV